MKTTYIPKGETVQYESLDTDRLVVRGCLRVAGDIRARIICGDGMIHAGSVHADVIRADEVECAEVVCKRLIAKRVHTPTLIASDLAVVSCFLSAAYVKTGKLTVAASEIDQLQAGEVVNLSAKKRGMLRTLLAAALRSFWVSFTTSSAGAALSSTHPSIPSTSRRRPQRSRNWAPSTAGSWRSLRVFRRGSSAPPAAVRYLNRIWALCRPGSGSPLRRSRRKAGRRKASWMNCRRWRSSLRKLSCSFRRTMWRRSAERSRN